MSDDVHARITRLEERIDVRLTRVESNLAVGFERMSAELAQSRGREKERAKWMAWLVAAITSIGTAALGWVLGLFGKH